MNRVPGWLADAILYQIYPQSFADSDGDGIGDLNGITEHLDHLVWLGVDTVWLNPCFTSPFRDAGYDVADYFTVAPRYGGNDDLAKLIDQARRRGIRVLLDLVAGHTSDRHPWFQASTTDPGDHRYIWADADPLPDRFVRSPGSRPGGYLPNFFDFQPALNFGYARLDPAEPWRQTVDAEGPRANRQALRDIMDHWLALGVSGFRVDMAASLVKDDPTQAETATLWNELRRWLDRRHPDAALLSEWGDPAVAVPAGFHADFFLQFGGPTDGLPWRSLLNNHHGTERDSWSAGECYFDAGGKGSARTFVDAYTAARNAIGDGGLIALPTSNHDFARPVCGPRTAEQLPAVFAFLLTWPTLPAIYYGDEIGMRYVPDLPDTEGSRLDSRYNRAGSRTPMQWDSTPNAGFSPAPANRLYLPLDAAPHRPTVAAQHGDPGSLLNTVRALIALRRNTAALHPTADLEVIGDGYPLAYLRGGDHLVVINPGGSPATLTHHDPRTPTLRLGGGVRIQGAEIHAEGNAWAIFHLLP